MKFLLPVLALLAMLGLWVAVQSLARRTAEAHPEHGPYREIGDSSGGGCGGGKGCGSCSAPADERCER